MQNNHRLIERIMHHPYYPWIVWGLAAGFFFLEYFARLAPAVMVDELMADFQIHAFALGALSAAFYYVYISMQIPVGMLADRLDPRWLLTINVLLCALGCIIFAISQSLHMAVIGRLIMGFGSAFAFVSSLKLATLWFPANRIGLLAGLTQALGMLGAAVSQAPMAYSVDRIGWRPTMWIITGLLLILAFFVGALVRDKPMINEKRLTRAKDVFVGLLTVFKNPQSWWNSLYAGLLYAPTVVIAELWGVKYFRQAYNLSNEVAAIGIGLIFVGWTISGPLVGLLSDHIKKRKPILFISPLLCLILITTIIFIPHLPLPLLFTLLFIYGVSNTAVATSYAVAAEINPHQLSGTSMAFANMVSVLVGSAFQPVIGWLLDKQWDGTIVNGIPVYSLQNFRTAMVTLPICLLMAIIAAYFIKETHCRAYE